MGKMTQKLTQILIQKLNKSNFDYTSITEQELFITVNLKMNANIQDKLERTPKLYAIRSQQTWIIKSYIVYPYYNSSFRLWIDFRLFSQITDGC